MLPCNTGCHAAYQDFVLTEIFHFYPDPFSLSKDTRKTIIEFWHLDLSLTDSLMLRSYLLSYKFKISSITRWVALLKENPLYATLSVFSFVDVPGIDTFYDFFSHLWDSDSDNLSPKERCLKPKAKRGKKNRDKTPADTESISSKLLPFFQRHPVKPSPAFSFVFQLYRMQFLDNSIKMASLTQQSFPLPVMALR